MCSVSYHKGNEEALVPPASSDPQLGTSLGEEPGHSPLGLMLSRGCSETPREGGLPAKVIEIPKNASQHFALKGAPMQVSPHLLT